MGCSQSTGAETGAKEASVSITDTDPSTKSMSQQHKLASANRTPSQRENSLIRPLVIEHQESSGLKANFVHLEGLNGRPIESVYDGVQDGKILGKGITGVVRLGTHKETGVKYAIKGLEVHKIASVQGLAALKEEIITMSQLDHPNIVRLEEVYESKTHIYLVQELCLGGELFDRLEEQPDYHYTEGECARLIKEILSAVRYLHSHSIVHRDLKLENFLFRDTSKDSDLVMIDFGLSKHFHSGDVLHEAVGTPYAVAPEVITGSYDAKCDVWAVGVICFLLLSGDPPFGGCDPGDCLLTVRHAILEGKFEFEPQDVWSVVSDHAKDFIKSLLVVDPAQRPTADQALQHEWLHDWDTKRNSVLNPKVVDSLVSFKEVSATKKLLCEVLSFTLLPEQIHDLHREFEKLDKDGNCELTEDELREALMSKTWNGHKLSEAEFQQIFDALRISKEEKSIHWHEFIAAELSLCAVDERNLRLAFEHLDADHKGYITFENLVNIMGSDAHELPELRKMWQASLEECQCDASRITYGDFERLMMRE